MVKINNNEPFLPDLVKWFQEGTNKGATHMIILWNNECYPPSYAFSYGESLERVKQVCGINDHIVKVYDLSVPLTLKQIDNFRYK